MSAICTQIALENVGASHYALRVISRMIDSLKDMDEKRSIIDLVYHKLCNQPKLFIQPTLASKYDLYSGQEDRHITLFTSSLPVCSRQVC